MDNAKENSCRENRRRSVSKGRVALVYRQCRTCRSAPRFHWHGSFGYGI